MLKKQYSIGTENVRSMNQGKLDVVKQEMIRINIDILLLLLLLLLSRFSRVQLCATP